MRRDSKLAWVALLQFAPGGACRRGPRVSDGSRRDAGIHTEVIFSLSGAKSITAALSTFGIANTRSLSPRPELVHTALVAWLAICLRPKHRTAPPAASTFGPKPLSDDPARLHSHSLFIPSSFSAQFPSRCQSCERDLYRQPTPLPSPVRSKHLLVAMIDAEPAAVEETLSQVPNPYSQSEAPLRHAFFVCVWTRVPVAHVAVRGCGARMVFGAQRHCPEAGLSSGIPEAVLTQVKGTRVALSRLPDFSDATRIKKA